MTKRRDIGTLVGRSTWVGSGTPPLPLYREDLPGPAMWINSRRKIARKVGLAMFRRNPQAFLDGRAEDAPQRIV